jgi:hypothetical protein
MPNEYVRYTRHGATCKRIVEARRLAVIDSMSKHYFQRCSIRDIPCKGGFAGSRIEAFSKSEKRAEPLQIPIGKRLYSPESSTGYLSSALVAHL